MHTASRPQRLYVVLQWKIVDEKETSWKSLAEFVKNRFLIQWVSGWIIGDPLSGLNSQLRSPSTGWMLYPVQRKKWWFHSAVEHTASLRVYSGSSQSWINKKKKMHAYCESSSTSVRRTSVKNCWWKRDFMKEFSRVRKEPVFDTVGIGLDYRRSLVWA